MYAVIIIKHEETKGIILTSQVDHAEATQAMIESLKMLGEKNLCIAIQTFQNGSFPIAVEKVLNKSEQFDFYQLLFNNSAELRQLLLGEGYNPPLQLSNKTEAVVLSTEHNWLLLELLSMFNFQHVNIHVGKSNKFLELLAE